MKNIIILILVISMIFISGCGEKTTEITAVGKNVFYMGPGSGIPGNCEWFIMPETQHGPAIHAINGPATAVGFQIRNGATIYFQDRYIGPNGDSYQFGSALPLNEWLEFNFVIYKSTAAGWLWVIGDFWPQLNDAIIESSYEWQVKFVDIGDGDVRVELADRR